MLLSYIKLLVLTSHIHGGYDDKRLFIRWHDNMYYCRSRSRILFKGGSWLMALVYIVHSTMSIQSMLMLGGLGHAPRKI